MVHAVGGALLSLRDTATPYPVDLSLANGDTRITLKGHIQDPFHLTGANLRLALSGPDMAKLYPLLGSPRRRRRRIRSAAGSISPTGASNSPTSPAASAAAT